MTVSGGLVVVAVAAVACGGATKPATVAPPPADDKPPPVDREAPPPPPQRAVDPLAILSPTGGERVSWLAPGPIQLELGGAGIESPGGNRPIEIAIADRVGSSIRATVRLSHARFSIWSDRARLFGVLARDHRIFPPAAPATTERVATLFAGAKVRRLAHDAKAKRTQVRYLGALQVEGWVPDDALADSAPARTRDRRAVVRRPLMLLPGSIIRSEPKWGNNELALVAPRAFVEQVRVLADGWYEVRYRDREVAVSGFASKRQPPGRIHRLQDPDVPPPRITPNAKVPSGTCLHSKRGGDAIGYIVGEQDVQLDDLGDQWWTLAIDTPWGPLPFAAKGVRDHLAACAPPSALPAVTSP